MEDESRIAKRAILQWALVIIAFLCLLAIAIGISLYYSGQVLEGICGATDCS